MLHGPFDALLFDMDGTLLTSHASMRRTWEAWAKRHALPPQEVFDYLNGRRAKDAIAYYLPTSTDQQRELEIAQVEQSEIDDTYDIAAIPDADRILAELPTHKWAMVTSASRRLALSRLTAAGLPAPEVMICAEDVKRGKPDPSGYLQAASLLGADIRKCLIFEDAPAGIDAGISSGASVAIISQSNVCKCEFSVSDYSKLDILFENNSIFIHK